MSKFTNIVIKPHFRLPNFRLTYQNTVGAFVSFSAVHLPHSTFADPHCVDQILSLLGKKPEAMPLIKGKLEEHSTPASIVKYTYYALSKWDLSHMTALGTLGSSFSVFFQHFLPLYGVWKLSSAIVKTVMCLFRIVYLPV